MGNQDTKQGQIFIQTENPQYQSGEIVNGFVHLIIKESFPGNTIHLKIKGVEECSWREEKLRIITSVNEQGKPTQTQEKYYEDFQGKNVFYSHKLKLHNWPNQAISPGQYSFPFQFLLQNQLPGTFIEVGSDYKAKIKYKIKAECESFNKNINKLKHFQEIVINSPISQMNQQLFGEIDQIAKVWCCFSKGTSHLKCYFEKNSYLSGDIANIFAEIDNSNCQLNIKNIKCRLISTLKLTSQSQETKIIKNVINEMEYQGIQAGQTAINDQIKKFPLQLIKNNNQQKQDPLRSSTNGYFVSSQYILEINANFDGCTCCLHSPQIQIPIQIITPPPEGYGQHLPPQNWQPQIFPVRLLQFNSQDIYTGNYQKQCISNSIQTAQNQNLIENKLN